MMQIQKKIECHQKKVKRWCQVLHCNIVGTLVSLKYS